MTTWPSLDRGNRKLAASYHPLDGLIPYARNARTHSDDQVAQIVASIREFGWTNPVELAGMSAAQRRAYILADNKLAENAGWDREVPRFGELRFKQRTDCR